MSASPDDESEDDSFAFGLSFAAAPCPDCERISGHPNCPDCGAAVPPPDELSEACVVRRDALLPFRDSAEGILARLDELPPARVPITSQAMLSGLVEARLFDRLVGIFGFGRELGEVGLDDPEAIRRKVVPLARRHVAALQSGFEACYDLSVFHSPPPGDQIAPLASEITRKAARTLVAYLAALTAIDLPAAEDAHREIQRELEHFEFSEAMDAIFGALPQTTTLDERLSRALARDGVYTDAWGNVDVGRVFWTFRADGDPFVAVGRRALQYFAPLLPQDAGVNDDHAAALLALPLLQIVSTDRPLVAHRLVRETYDLLRAALNVDRTDVAQIVERHAAGGSLVLGLHNDAVMALENAPTPQEAAAGLVAAYQRIAQTWAAYAGVMLELDNSARGGGSARNRDLEVSGVGLRVLVERLSESDTEALQTLAGCLAPELCADPSGYGWDPDDESLVHPQTDGRWDLDEFEEQLDRLVAGIAGADAGYCIGVVTETLGPETPTLVEGPASGYAAEVLARCVFGAAGAAVLAVAADASTTVVAPLDGDLDAVRLLSATAGLAAVFLDTVQFEVVDDDGEIIVAISADALRRAREPSEVIGDLTTIAAFEESLIARGDEPGVVTLRLAASQAVLIGHVGLRRLADSPSRALAHLGTVDRVSYGMAFLQETGDKSKAIRKHRERLGRVRASCAAAARGDGGADRRAIDLLAALADWGRGHGGAALPL